MIKGLERTTIYESVNQLFKEAIALKDSTQLLNYMKFLERLPMHAPFNNALVFIQNPECSYYASASQWKIRYNRTLKNDAKPMLILKTFGPVEFVYDISSTEGNDIDENNFLFWWKEKIPTLNEYTFKRTLRNMSKYNIELAVNSLEEYYGCLYNSILKEDKFRKMGEASKNIITGKRHISIHPKYKEPSIEAYGVICHELAHHLLGHLGSIISRTNRQDKIIVNDRSYVSNSLQEVEAETVAWIVFSRHCLEKNSAEYIACNLKEASDLENLNFSLLLTVAEKIYQSAK